MRTPSMDLRWKAYLKARGENAGDYLQWIEGKWREYECSLGLEPWHKMHPATNIGASRMADPPFTRLDLPVDAQAGFDAWLQG